jgi:hypothetical protein
MHTWSLDWKRVIVVIVIVIIIIIIVCWHDSLMFADIIWPLCVCLCVCVCVCV